MYSRLSPKAKPSQRRAVQATVVLPVMWEQTWGLDGEVGESNITLGRAILKLVWLELRKCNEHAHASRKKTHARTQAQVRMTDCMHADADDVRTRMRAHNVGTIRNVGSDAKEGRRLGDKTF